MSTSAKRLAPAIPAGTTRRGGELAHWAVLCLATGVVVSSLVLSLGSEPGQVVLPLINRPLPPLCNLKSLTGVDCPGCGLTRSFIALAHGQWRDSFRFNPAGPLWFAFIGLQVPYQALQLRRIYGGKRPLDLSWWGQGIIYACLAALILQWVVRQCFGAA